MLDWIAYQLDRFIYWFGVVSGFVLFAWFILWLFGVMPRLP